ncbi:MAG TPA: RDD family protein [Bryobacteraceae bacterium]|jgi:uncharacterized RDD family membrane protein YckC|nr:RDD family protein [Bryobacteraceae bacterium]
MKWYYADAGRQVGPVEDAQLDELVRSGAVRDDTLVWREGMANWQPHSAVRGPAKPIPIPAAAVPIAAETRFCSECGRPYPAHEMVTIGTATVCAQCKPLYMQRVREGGQPIGVRRYAGFWIRFVARIIDGIILGVVGFIINLPIQMAFGLGASRITTGGDVATALPMMLGTLGVSLAINLVLQAAYEIYFLSSRGATIGKLALGLKVIRADGGPLSTGQATGRFFAYLLDAYFTLTIGFIIAGFDAEKRSLHDRICDTRVIYAK